MGDCAIDTCDQPAEGEYCPMHAKRRQRGGDMDAPVQERSTPIRERIQKLASNLADCDSEDDAAYDRAWEALRKAVEQWSRVLAAQRNALKRWAKSTPAERTAFASRIARARWSVMHASKHAPARRRVRRAGKRPGGGP